MNETKAFGRHKYTWLHKMLSTAMVIGPFVWSMIFILRGQSLAATISFVGGLVLVPLMIPLVVKYFTFVMVLDEKKIDVAYFRTRRTIRLDDVVDVRVKGMHTLESVYVRDRSGDQFCFETGVNNFEALKRFFLARGAANNLRDDEKRALGRHKYPKGYRMILVIVLIAIWSVAVAVFPKSLWKGGLTADDVNAIALSIILIGMGIPGILAALNELTFSMEIDEEGMCAKWRGAEKKILFGNISKISISRWASIETLSIADSLGNKIVFNRFLEEYDGLKRYLFRRYEEVNP